MRWMGMDRLRRKTCVVRGEFRGGGSLGNRSHRVESDLGGGAGRDLAPVFMISSEAGRSLLEAD